MHRVVLCCIVGGLTAVLFAQELSVFDLDLKTEDDSLLFYGEANLGFGIRSLMNAGALEVEPLGGLSLNLDYDSESVSLRSELLVSDDLRHLNGFSMIHRLLIQNLGVTYQFSDIGLNLQLGYYKPLWNETNLIEVEDTVHVINYSKSLAQLLHRRLHPSLMLRVNYYIDTDSLLEAWYVPIYEAGLHGQEYWEKWLAGRSEMRSLQELDLRIPQSGEGGQTGVRYAYNGSIVGVALGYSYLYFPRPSFEEAVYDSKELLQLDYDPSHRFTTAFDVYIQRFRLFSQAAMFLSNDITLSNPLKNTHELRYDFGLQYETSIGVTVGADVNGIFVFAKENPAFIKAADFELLSRADQKTHIARSLQSESISFRFFIDTLLFGGVLQSYMEVVLEYPQLQYLVQSRLSVLLHTSLRMELALGIYETASSAYFNSFDTQDYLSIALRYSF